jgi:hypothetical protein
VGRYKPRPRARNQATPTEVALAQFRLHFEPYNIDFGHHGLSNNRNVLLKHYLGADVQYADKLADLDAEIQDLGGYAHNPQKRAEAAAVTKT